MSELPRYEQYPQFPPSAYSYPAPPRRRRWLPVLLFGLTFLTTTSAGAQFYAGFYSSLTGQDIGSIPLAVLGGLWFSIPVLMILFAHEMGHYLTCRLYGIDATLPYFLPGLPIIGFGTFGAVIRIKSPFGDRRQLFDVAIGGPLGGFLLIVPALILGVASSVEFEPRDASLYYSLGEPLIYQFVDRLFTPVGIENATLHPIGLAAWLGLLVTSLNLLPIGQLDGGHIVYAVFGPRGHRICSYATLAGLAVLGIFASFTYLVFGGLAYFLAFSHPPVSRDWIPLGRKRILLALLALLIFVLCFMPIPIETVYQ